MKMRTCVLTYVVVNLFLISYSFADEMIGFFSENYSKPLPEIKVYEHVVDHKYSLFTHRRNYILPISIVDKPANDLYSQYTNVQRSTSGEYYQNTEAEFQISFFIPVIRRISNSSWDLNFAYTHHSWWQVYNVDWSQPFRETNYNPEVFFRYLEHHEINILGFKLLSYGLGYAHQSNGQIQLLSRSWDRLFSRFTLAGYDSFLLIEAWLRLPEGVYDDNPGITDYMGHGKIGYQKNIGHHSLEFHIPVAKNFSLEAAYSYPVKDGVRVFASYRTGGGQSLIDYNRASNRYALGIALDHFFDNRKFDPLKD